MTYAQPESLPGDPYRLGRSAPGPAGAPVEGGPAPKRIVVGYGFWIFILSDIVMFSSFFAAYAVLGRSTAGGPTSSQIFDLTNTAWETALLLVSSFCCGLASLAAGARRMAAFQLAMGATFLFGAGFLALEAREFTHLAVLGDGPQRSAFLSAFFSLVGCHGIHVTCGVLWLLTMMAQVLAKGFRADILRRILCFTLFWHALDIIWVAIFTIVYLLGS